MIDYDGLIQELERHGIGRTELGKAVGLSSRTVAKISRGEKLASRSLSRIAEYLGCEPGNLFRVVSDNILLQALRDEKEAGISGGIYHELQVRMTYNSNHMEGSKLSEDQTRMIWETDIIDAGDGIPVDDILETVHHFRAIDYCIDNAELDLTEEMIKKLHYIIKHDTVDSRLPWFAVGEYKRRPNMVGGLDTVKPDDVGDEMKKLLADYLALEEVTIEDIIAFHARFEQIHPFQDGNGRVGRLIAFKECLNHNIVPFIIEGSKKAFYYRGLSNWNKEKGWLTDTCLDGQDTMQILLASLGID